ncbi:MAG: 2-amino-4-hydroxy-6-hydroxymethyldihydropteridine diphosphokinase [Sphingobacteriales bacterium]|nr:2-amino-4-hydroxy-6-hydroxymethyldihydropteridine diphosphokinase [Sphingobacteriales bacterium]
MQDVYILLGSNLGNSINNIEQAIGLIEANMGKVKVSSSLYKTAAWGNYNQPDFINQVIVIESLCNPRQLLKNISVIENFLGRKRSEKWGSRTIDIDILFYGNDIIDEADLKIPHIELHKRRFTLMPLMEIVPDFIHPKLNKTIKELFQNLTDTLPVQQLNFNI